ncbi:hypothetical protein [Pseudobacteriovorax antillogorgiicola]|uniref:Uncharacterized protein n=1 Tax=Pseudobacteriovorax antillogorgiicola TaxID=1513793 RepID=A0A1Y6BKW3_9BACT|nr:hypothetical protein [Pseudobacteriovorax antillogorgiicola]TCS54654.1 hypothetical protein EDD56_106167 [Pseudobacteriovorax antillogorgiicola]SMF16864.1 hypothetical protein SAMN06296036_10676 [Pseudobacteriovorax antillogorgiicola]
MVNKVFSLLVLGAVANHANASELEFSCRTPESFTPGYMHVDVNIEGTIKLNAKNNYTLSYETLVDLKMVGDTSSESWARFDGAETAVQNYSSYKPRKYIDHMKFNLDDKLGSSGRSWGDFDFIVPHFSDASDLGQEFKAYLIMSGVDDHFGTTAPLLCKQTKETPIKNDDVCSELFEDSWDFMANKSWYKYVSALPEVMIVKDADKAAELIKWGWLRDDASVTTLAGLSDDRKARIKTTLNTYNEFDDSLSFEENFSRLISWDGVLNTIKFVNTKNGNIYEYLYHYPGDNEYGKIFNHLTGEVAASVNDGGCYLD